VGRLDFLLVSIINVMEPMTSIDVNSQAIDFYGADMGSFLPLKKKDLTGSVA